MTATISRKSGKNGKPLPAEAVGKSENSANHRLIPCIGIDAGTLATYRTVVGTEPKVTGLNGPGPNGTGVLK